MEVLDFVNDRSNPMIFNDNSLIAQSVERRTVNPQVPGSSPGRGAKKLLKYKHLQGAFILIS